MRRILISLCTIAVSLALLWHFSNIWRFGEHIIREPNIVILISETLLLIGILLFGIYSFIKELKGGKEG